MAKEGWLNSRLRNSKVRAVNGNRGQFKQTLRLFHWNTGNGWWESKLDEVLAVIEEKDPDIFVVTEANLRANIPEEQTIIDGYEMVLPRTMNSQGYARIVLLIKEGVNYERLENCMDEGAASVWIRVEVKGRRKLNIGGGVYRDHKLLLQPQPNMSGDPQLQRMRWRKILNGWKKGAKDAKCIVIGDTNLDYSKWNQPEQRVASMVNETKLEIETIGFVQMIGNMTRSWPGQPESLVDQIWTNMPGGIMTTSNQLRGPWDHNLIGAVIRTRDRSEQQHEVLKRNRNNLNVERYRDKNWTAGLDRILPM